MKSLALADWLVVGVTITYAVAAVLYAVKRNWPSCVVFAGYAVANVGVLWALVRVVR
jgi:hypothetical protein